MLGSPSVARKPQRRRWWNLAPGAILHMEHLQKAQVCARLPTAATGPCLRTSQSQSLQILQIQIDQKGTGD